jgi:CubicO group peptidase (beta-lactamase class C family)
VTGLLGHFGFGGSGAWADPRRDLAVALIVNSGMGTPFGDLRIARVSGAALRCANARQLAPGDAALTAGAPPCVMRLSLNGEPRVA